MKKVFFFVSIVLFLFIINNFIHSIYGLWQKQDLITEARSDLTREKNEQHKLEAQLNVVQNPSYVEEEARDKLLMARPGEEVVVLPPTPVPTVRAQSTARAIIPVWQQWYRLFF